MWCHESSATAASLSLTMTTAARERWNPCSCREAQYEDKMLPYACKTHLFFWNIPRSASHTFERRRRRFAKPPVSSVRGQCELNTLSAGQTWIFLCRKNCAGLCSLKNAARIGPIKCALESRMLLVAFTRGEPTWACVLCVLMHVWESEKGK